MYLHLGADYMVKHSDIIAIFNLHHEESHVYENYIERYKNKYEIIDATEGELCCSLVLTEDKLYLSTISSVTLQKRVEDNVLLEFDMSQE